MIRYKKVLIDADNTEEAVENILFSTETVKRKLLAVLFDPTADIDGRVYLDQDRIVDVPCSFLPADILWVQVNRELAVGETIKAGYYNHSGADVEQWVTISYEEV